jgi:hypothetical protein
MFCGPIASSIWSAATTALMSPNSATTPVSLPSTNPNGSSSANATTGSSNPFQTLSSDLQAWLNQNQAVGNGTQTTSAAQSQPHVHHHHHHHGGGIDQATQSYAASNAQPAAPQTQSATA